MGFEGLVWGLMTLVLAMLVLTDEFLLRKIIQVVDYLYPSLGIRRIVYVGFYALPVAVAWSQGAWWEALIIAVVCGVILRASIVLAASGKEEGE